MVTKVENITLEFNEMINSNAYITWRKYNQFLEKYEHIFKEASNNSALQDIANNGYQKIEEHNNLLINKKLILEQDYFDNIFKNIDANILLDEEQRKAILEEEDYSLIIAGAGSGKTTTMAAKVKYLIEKKGIHPSKIAVVSYTNKAIEELEDRIKYDFNLPVDIMTFHSLGMRIIKKIFKNPLLPVSENEQKEIIMEFIKNILWPNKDLLTQYVETFNKYNYQSNKMFSKGFVENYKKFPTFESYFEDYKARKQAQNSDNLENIIAYRTEAYLKGERPRSIKNEIMRSKAEAKIANFLFTHGIEYKYEEPYPEKIAEDRTYLPDFTIEVDGIPLYIEYFGLSNFYENGSISERNQKKYNDIRKKKREFHKLNHNNYIELDYKKEEEGKSIHYLKDLELKLQEHHVPFRKLSNYEIYNQILDNNTMAEFYRFVDFILDLISDIKSHIKRDDYIFLIQKYIEEVPFDLDIKREMKKEANLFIKIYAYYNQELIPKNKIDFADMIYYANKYITEIPNSKNLLDYEYLIIDEYQDISIDRYQFTRNISLLSNAKVTSVGDDWQTIFSFAGSRIDLFLKYNRLFPGAKQLFINNTYRNSQELIDRAGMFIMRNPLQIKKSLLSNVTRTNPLKFYHYDKNQYDIVRNILKKIHNNNPNDNVLILARKNKHISKMFETDYFTEGVDSRVVFKDYPNMIIDAMSIHSAKGLGADQVILLNVTNDDFPCPNKEDIWLNNLFKPQGYNENYPFAEDRRIFYVALTRTKKDVYLLLPLDKPKISPFVEELYIKEG